MHQKRLLAIILYYFLTIFTIYYENHLHSDLCNSHKYEQGTQHPLLSVLLTNRWYNSVHVTSYQFRPFDVNTAVGMLRDLVSVIKVPGTAQLSTVWHSPPRQGQYADLSYDGQGWHFPFSIQRGLICNPNKFPKKMLQLPVDHSQRCV